MCILCVFCMSTLEAGISLLLVGEETQKIHGKELERLKKMSYELKSWKDVLNSIDLYQYGKTPLDFSTQVGWE